MELFIEKKISHFNLSLTMDKTIFLFFFSYAKYLNSAIFQALAEISFFSTKNIKRDFMHGSERVL